MLKKRIIALLLIILTAMQMCVFAKAEDYLIIRFKDGFTPPYEQGFKQLSQSLNIYRVKKDMNLEALQDYIIYTEPDREIIIADDLRITPPSKTLMMMSPGETELTDHLKLINADAAWSLEAYGNDVKVAVIDSGCDAEHPELLGNVLKGKNYFDDSDDTDDNYGHGTHVSGIIAALMNGYALSGIAPKAKIVPLKCFKMEEVSSNEKTEVSVDTADFIRAIDDAVNTFYCKVINMSFGGGSSFGQALTEVIDDAYQKGVILIASVGNYGNRTVYYPAGCDSVIGVGSVSLEKEKSEFSQFNESVFVVAPGEDVRSTIYNHKYGTASGTSQAAPYVSGLAALAVSVDPDMTPDKFKEILIKTSEDLGDEGFDTAYGYGLINVRAFTDYLMSEQGCYVSPINSEDGKNHVLIKNNTSDVLNILSYFAEYENGVLKNIEKKLLEIAPNGEATAEIADNGNKTTHFLWDSVLPIPLCEARTVND